MMAFQRYLNRNCIESLKLEPLFNCLRPDIESGIVFPAIRQNRVDFYYGGGKLFSYNCGYGFTTHYKYASVCGFIEKNHYIAEDDFANSKRFTSFSEDWNNVPNYVYQRIKENCAAYAREEARAVSHLYAYSCTRKKPKHPEIVVLDVEVAFKRTQEAGTNSDQNDDAPNPDRERSLQDRIDFVLLNNKTGEIRFFEAKCFSNNDLRAKEGKEPPIVRQLKRYRAQLDTDIKRQEIATQYQEHVNAIQEILGHKLASVEKLHVNAEPRLYICGFDADQKIGRLSKNLRVLKDTGVFFYAKGEPKTVESIQELWNSKSKLT